MPLIPRPTHEYYVFLASPGDVNPERQAVRDFFKNLNDKLVAADRSHRFVIIDWENYATIGVGRPQDLITQQTLERYREQLALVIGILGQRFGSPSGTHESGTEEEFEWALQHRLHAGWPEIKWFFGEGPSLKKSADPQQRQKDFEQWDKVCAFRERLLEEKKIFCGDFTDTANFRDVLRDDLERWLNNPERPWNASALPLKKSVRRREPKTEALPPAQREKLLADYLTYVIERTQDLPLHGIYSPKGEQFRVKLEQVFVSLKAARTRTAEAERAWLRKEQRLMPGDDEAVAGESDTLTMEAALKAHRHLVILGVPGSGKTTLSQYVALCYARDRAPGSTSTLVRDRLQLEERGHVPLLLLLRDLGKYFKTYAPVDDGTEGLSRLLEFFHRALQDNHLAVPKDFFEEDLRQGRVVVLLDGMDEVGDRELRRRVARMIENFAARYPLCRIIVTSRIVGYEDETRLERDFAITTIRDFTPEDVRLFLQQWHRHVAELDYGPGERALLEAEHNTTRLLQEIETHDRLGDLAINPLILTVIALLHREDLKLPERRVDLYGRVVELLLGRRDERRGVESGAVFEQLVFGLEERQEVFQAIALAMHSATSKEIALDDLKDLLKADFERRTTDRGAIKRAVERFLKSVLERTGLLVDAGNEVYRFSHLSFQEYLVARQMAESETYVPDTLARLADPFWREVILLECGCLSKERRNRLIRAIAEAPVAKERTGPLHNPVLAADCLHDAGLGKVDVAVLTELRHQLQSVVEQPLPEDTDQERRRAFTVRRVTAAQALGRIADDAKNAQEALALEHSYWSLPYGEPEWVTIPAGEFSMGSAPGDDLAYDNEKPLHRVFVSEFRLARTPVTNVQYWLYVQETEVDLPAHWRGKSPARDIWTHPVIYVNWEDAQAYCAWLGAKIGKPVRLPTEAEWEKAARGDRDTRRYPWGDQFDVARCNSGELWEGTEAGGTSPVGLFLEGVSPYGCLDMSGNVWEWVSDWFDESYYQKSPERNPQGPVKGDYRSLRGGSWRLHSRSARASRRSWDGPGNRGGRYGLRCAQ
ncbi:MAG: SUMF1/EgtB/PvdO family nonheme iron enzyme [Deltaproteobacteria bacterium]|nr:SUMF1/EgtB/PvdO family nonheme iron enzyme [Deltaproteobacteria bacterium]